jgi:hypothetical protein
MKTVLIAVAVATAAAAPKVVSWLAALNDIVPGLAVWMVLFILLQALYLRTALEE